MAASKGRVTGAIKNPNKGGPGKAMIASSGGGRAALVAYRGMSKESRASARAAAGGRTGGLTEIVRLRTNMPKPSGAGGGGNTGSARRNTGSTANVMKGSARQSTPTSGGAVSRGDSGPAAPRTPPNKPMGSRGAASSRDAVARHDREVERQHMKRVLGTDYRPRGAR